MTEEVRRLIWQQQTGIYTLISGHQLWPQAARHGMANWEHLANSRWAARVFGPRAPVFSHDTELKYIVGAVSGLPALAERGLVDGVIRFDSSRRQGLATLVDFGQSYLLEGADGQVQIG